MIKKLLILLSVVALMAMGKYSYLSTKDKAYSAAIASPKEPSTKQIALEAWEWAHHIPNEHTEEFNRLDRIAKQREANH